MIGGCMGFICEGWIRLGVILRGLSGGGPGGGVWGGVCWLGALAGDGLAALVISRRLAGCCGAGLGLIGWCFSFCSVMSSTSILASSWA